MTPSDPSGSVEGEIVILSEPEGVIFPEGYFPIADEELFPYWTPTRDMIVDAESRVVDFLSHPLPENAEEWQHRTHLYAQFILAKLPKYRRQYWGIVFQDQPAIYMKFFPEDRIDGDWTIGPFFVCDGGHSYFQLIFNPEKREFVQITVNGEA